MRNTFGNDGGYKVDSGDYDDMQEKVSAELRLNPKTVRGLDQFRPGDEVTLQVKAKVGEIGEDGMMELDVVRAQAEDMDYGAKVERARESSSDSSGTMLGE